MKIIGSDNHARDSVPEFVWLDDLQVDILILNRICDRLNMGLNDHSGTYYHAVADTYVLYKADLP